MVKTGILRIDNNTGISRLDSGTDKTRLAKENGGDPFGDATDFLVDGRDLDKGDFIWVVGEPGTHAGVNVIFISDAGLAAEATGVSVAKKKG